MSNETKHLIVTGATGFIGSFIVEKAMEQNWTIIVLSRSGSNVKWLKSKGIDIFETDFGSVKSIKTTLEQILTKYGSVDYMVHNAGVTKANDGFQFDLVNHQYTHNLLVATMQSGMNLQKFVFISSLAAIGHGDENSLEPIKSDSSPQPDTVYGKSKLKAENYIKTLNNINWLIIRPTGVYGPREKDYFLMLKTIKKGLAPIIGFRTQYLTFVHASDLANVIISALKSQHKQKAYIVSDGNTYTSIQYRTMCKQMLNKNAVNLTVPLALLNIISWVLQFTFGLFGKTPTLNRDKFYTLKASNWKCDISDTIADFNYHPEYNLNTGLKQSIEWYQKEGWL